MKYDVFISYSSKDQKIVEGLCAYLEQYKIRCFVAYRDIPRGKPWPPYIPEALEESRMMVVVFSGNFNHSEEVDRELTIASKKKKPILTFRLSDEEFKGTKEYYLSNINWIDAFPNPENAFSEVTDSIAKLLDINVDSKKDSIREKSNTNEISDKLKNTIKLAELGVAQAQYELGLSYFSNTDFNSGGDFMQDYSQAVKWYLKSAEQGHIEAQVKLGICYANGLGVDKDENKAYYWWQKAAEQGHEFAIFFMKSKESHGIIEQSIKGTISSKDAVLKLKQKNKCKLILRSATPKLVVIKAIKDVLKISLVEAKNIVENTPAVIYEANRWNLMSICKKIENLLPDEQDMILEIEDCSDIKQWIGNDDGKQIEQERIEREKLEAEEKKREEKEEKCKKGLGFLNGHEYVDLGLPSGLKWATCNVGANKPEEYGDYFAWGEIETKDKYTQENSLTYDKPMKNISGNPEYDVARVNWGSSWRIPTKEELEELVDYCIWKRMCIKGVSGVLVTGPNGNSVFLPAAGYCGGTSIDYAGSFGGYWSSTPNDFYNHRAYGFNFYAADYEKVDDYGRGYGQCIRPVSE